MITLRQSGPSSMTRFIVDIRRGLVDKFVVLNEYFRGECAWYHLILVRWTVGGRRKQRVEVVE